MEPEVAEWLESLAPAGFAVVASRIERLEDLGAALRMPHSKSLGDGLFELRFALGPNIQRITFFFPGDGRIVLLTAFHKQRSNERLEVDRARLAMRRCVQEGHTAEGEET
jgi:putative component of toxin-antitoxin plasmid stabilization module